MTVSGYDDLGVVNLAAPRVGWREINSIADPSTDKEYACAALFPITLDALLSKHDWKFANPTSELAVDADAPSVGGYLYAYTLPSDLIAGPFAVYTAADLKRPISDYMHANDYIYSNETSCIIKYRARPDVGKMPAYFIDLLAVVLAARLATTPQVNKPELAGELRIEAYGDARLGGEGGLFKTAKNIDARSAPMKSFVQNGDPLTGLVF